MSRGSYCIVITCYNNKLSNPDVSFFTLPKNQNLAKHWVESVGREDLLVDDKYLKAGYRICSSHFLPSNFKKTYPRKMLLPGSIPIPVSVNTISSHETHNPKLMKETTHPNVSKKNTVPPSTSQILPYRKVCKTEDNENDFTACAENVDGAHLNIISNSRESLSGNENTQEYNCRTCLTKINKQCCTRITEHCTLGKTVKEAVMLLVPKMFSRLKNSDVVCKDCFTVLESSVKFIITCLEIEDRYEVNREIIKHVEEQTQEQRIHISGVSEIDNEYDYHEQTDSDNKDFNSEEDPVVNYIDVNSIKTEPEDLYESKSEYPPSSHSSSDYIEEDNRINMKKSVPPKRKIIEQECTSLKKRVRQTEFSCSSCSERFTSKAYEDHLKIHPPYVCSLCGDTFFKKKSLNVYEFTHSDPNSFICKVCNKGNEESTLLPYHIDS